MLRTLLLATALLSTSGTALAHNDHGYGRVVSVEPQFSIAFGSRHHDGFRVLYESGGTRYWTYTPHHPGPVIVLPPPHYRVQPVYYHHDYGRGWDDRRDDWGDHGRRGHRRHGRD